MTLKNEPQAVSRRAALGLLAGAAALVTRTGPSEAAFGDAANVFGRTTNKSGNESSLVRRMVYTRSPSQLVRCPTPGFVPYAGEGYALLLPSKWNPSKEREANGIQLRWVLSVTAS